MNELLANGVPNISPEQFVYLMEKNGSLYEQLGNIEEGIACFENILERLPEHIETIKTLGRLYARAEMWEKLIVINEQEAALINDQHRIVSLLCKCGEVCERNLKDEARAIDYFRKVLQLSPAYHPAVKALGEIYVRLARWEDLIRMYHRELDSTDEVERKTAIRYRIAQIYEEDLHNPRKAEVNYRQILEEDSGFMPALHALVRLYNRSGNTEALLEIHNRQFERASEDQQRIFHLCKIAEIHENERNELDEAVDTHKRILELDPANRLARQSLGKLYGRLERREELLTLLRRELVEEENDTRRLSLLASVAHIFEDLGRMDEAIETYREIVTAAPQQKSAYVQLEHLLRMQQRYSELADLYKRWLPAEEEPRRLTLLRSLADILELHLDDREAMAKTYASILELQPNDSEALDFFEEAYAEAAEWEQLVEVYDRKLALAIDDQSKVRLATAAAYILELELGRKEEALDRYEAALAINPAHFAAVQGARRLYSMLERWGKLAELLEAELKNSYSSSYYVATAYQYGYLLETKFSKRGAACDLYRKVLELKPRHRESFIRLRKILEEERNHLSLVEILEKRLEVLEIQAEQVDMNRHIAEIAEHELSDIEKAIKHRSMVLELLPENLEEMYSLAKLYQKGAHWMDAIDYYRKVANRLEDNDGLRDVYFNIGEIYRNGIMDSEQAVIAFEKVIEYDPDDLHGLEQLAELYSRLEHWGKSADVLEKLLDYELPKERAVRYHLLLGEIYLDHLNSRVKAVPNFEKALAYNPSSQQSIETLAGIFSREERWDQLVDIYLNNLEVIPEGEVDQRVALYMGLGQIYCSHLNDVEKALDSYRSAQELDPQNALVWEKQSEAMGRSAIYYLDAIEKHRALLEVNPYRVESYRELYRIFSERQERDHAFCAAMVLEFLRAETPEQSEFLRQCRQFTAGEVMGVIIPESDRTNLLMHPDEKGLARDILTALDPIIFKTEEVDLEPYDLPSCRVAGVASSIYHLMESTAYYLGVELFKLYISQKQPNQLAVENTKPPTIVIGGSLAYASEGIKRFLAGYVVGRIGNGHVVYSQRDSNWLQLMVETICHMYVPDFEVQGSTASQVEELEKELSRNLPPSSRAEMEDKARAYAMQNERPDFNKILSAMQYSDDRMGMVMAGELHSAIESAYHLEFGKPFRSARETEEIVMQFADQPRIGAMFEFCVSEDYFNLRNIVRQNIE